jgi:hypothetical protein
MIFSFTSLSIKVFAICTSFGLALLIPSVYAIYTPASSA